MTLIEESSAPFDWENKQGLWRSSTFTAPQSCMPCNLERQEFEPACAAIWDHRQGKVLEQSWAVGTIGRLYGSTFKILKPPPQFEGFGPSPEPFALKLCWIARFWNFVLSDIRGAWNWAKAAVVVNAGRCSSSESNLRLGGDLSLTRSRDVSTKHEIQIWGSGCGVRS